MKYFLGVLFALIFIDNSTAQLEIHHSQMVVTTPGAVISNKHFSVQGEQALVILADSVTVQKCLFSECDWAILIRGADGVTITGNRFENVGEAIRSKDYCNDITIQYNEARGVGLRDPLNSSDYLIGQHGYWAGNFMQATYTNTADISYNIIDNQGLDTKYLEDFINIWGPSPNVTIRGNRIRGTSNACSVSGSGGGIVIDCEESNYLVEDNICVRSQAYGIATAGGSNTIIQNNWVYQPLDHVDGLNKHPSIPFRGGGSFAYGNTGYNGCGSNNKLLDNHGYSISANAQATGCEASVNGSIWNVYDECGWAENSGNDFPASDPGWDTLLPADMFADLGTEYFSGSVSVTKYNLTTSITGSGSVSPSGGSYSDGTVVPLTATGVLGYAFSEWTGDLSGSDNPGNIVMDTNKHVVANFTSIPTYTLTTNTDGNGVILPESGTFNQNEEVIVKASGLSGYGFSSWGGDLSGSENPASIIMDSDKSITAFFVSKESPLLAYWPMDETEGTSLSDASGSELNATLNNSDASTFVEGKLDNAVYFNGSRDASVDPAGELQVQSLTIAAYVKVDAGLTEWAWVAGHGDNYGLVVNRNDNGGVFLYFYDGAGWPGIDAGNVDIRDGKWHHVAGTFDHLTGTIGIYLDGQLASSGSAGGQITYSIGNDFHIGSMQGQRFFYGAIDELRVYSEALIEEDIAKLANLDISSSGERWDTPVSGVTIYPNPFTDVVKIRYDLVTDTHVKIEIIDLTGRITDVLSDTYQQSGAHIISWNGCNPGGEKLKDGIYLMQLHFGKESVAHKIVLNR